MIKKILFLILPLLIWMGCTQVLEEEKLGKSIDIGSDACLYCHTNKARLQALTPTADRVLVSMDSSDVHLNIIKCVVCHGGDESKPNSRDDAHTTGLIVSPNEGCVACHSDSDRLKGLVEDGERVYVNVDSSDEHFSQLKCTDCHVSRDDNTQSKKLHGHLISNPSQINANNSNSCAGGNCHLSILETYREGLHQNMWGARKMVALRTGVQTFEQCPQSTIDGFNRECASCHASCSDCHISIPQNAGGGFLNSHKFTKSPDPEKNCLGCHDSRIGVEFRGDPATGRPADIHKEKYGFTCLNCHEKDEMHGSAADSSDRYHYNELPSCEESGCHSAGSQLPTKNTYHLLHFNKMACAVCHAEPYNNCSSCHVDNAWKSDPSFHSSNPTFDFRIGNNPNKTSSGRFRFKYIAVRHIPIAPDTYANWGTASASLPDYDKYPTWKYASPHTIRRFTERTQVAAGKQCYQNCHTKTGLGDPANKKYYLYRDYIQANWPAEVNANEATVVDGKLPSGW